MTISIGTCSCEYNRINKSGYLNLTDHVGSIKDPGNVDILAPSVLIDASIAGANYAYIPDFGRYYFVTGLDIIRTGLTLVTLKVDPLATFAAQILGLGCVCERTSAYSQQNGYLVDTHFLDYGYNKISFYTGDPGAQLTFGYTGNYVLITAG